MSITESRRDLIMPYAVAVVLFVVACVLQQTDDLVADFKTSKLLALAAQFIFFGILTYWTVSVISRVSDKSIKFGLATTIILMSSVMFLKLIKYNVLFDATAERYTWYAYYIPQCLAPVVLLLTVLKMARKSEKPLSARWNLLFLPAVLLILFVFTNDLHEQVFSFAEGLQNANEVYRWEWGYFVILCWIAWLYLAIGALLFVKCRISHCRRKAWIPLVLFVLCLVCCILREVFNPLFIKMPETVVFSVVIVCESLIKIGLIPSNSEYARFFDVADVSAMIADKDLNVELSSKNAPEITHKQALTAAGCGEVALSRDVVLKAKSITGGEVFWTEDMSVINRINDDLAEISATLAEEIDLVTAENRLKEQCSKIEEQNNLYKEIFNIAKPHFGKIRKRLSKATTNEEKDEALRGAVVQGVFLKRRSNLMLMKRDGKVSVSELVYALREAADALTFCNVHSSVFADCDGDYPFEQIELVFKCFEDSIECALPDLPACLVRLSAQNGNLSCRIALDSVEKGISENWRQKERDRLGAMLKTETSDETLYVTLTFGSKGGVRNDTFCLHKRSRILLYDDCISACGDSRCGMLCSGCRIQAETSICSA